MILLNEYTIKPTIFPDGTSQVWKIPPKALEPKYDHKVEWIFENEAEFLHLAQLKILLDEINPSKTIQLYLPYLPYGRQDKIISNSTTFALCAFSYLLNALDFDAVTCMDPHSAMPSSCITNFYPIYPLAMVQNAFNITKSDLVCYPDKGALTKYSGFKDKIYDFPNIYAEKIRDQSTGTILSMEVKGGICGRSILIVDDICDGGMTFIMLTKRLLELGAREVNLFVSHGIFSKGLEPLLEAGIKRIFTKEREIT